MDFPAYNEVFDALPWPHLRSLTIHLPLSTSGNFWSQEITTHTNRPVYERLSSILRTFRTTSPLLSTVALVVDCSAEIAEDLSVFYHWELFAVEEVLLSFPAIRTVRFHTGQFWNDFGQAERAIIRSVLPSLDKAGILEL